jgi:hypothetical protein
LLGYVLGAGGESDGMTPEQVAQVIVESVQSIVTTAVGRMAESLKTQGSISASLDARRIGRLWRCTWIRPDLTSVELAMPPLQAFSALRDGVSVALIRSALVRCIDVPGNAMEHACFVEADTMEGAVQKARALHPGWQAA